MTAPSARQPSSSAPGPTWIWYPGDFEIWLAMQVQTRRTERDVFVPPFWRMDGHHVTVTFLREVELAEAERIEIRAEGRYNVAVDGAYVVPDDGAVQLPAGRHLVAILVHNQRSVPALWVAGRTVVSSPVWRASLTRNPLALENTHADAGGFDRINEPPSAFRLRRTPVEPVSTRVAGRVTLADFGAETFGFAVLRGLRGQGKLLVCYGESEQEALSPDACETHDRVSWSGNGRPVDHTVPASRAFRYVAVYAEPGVSVGGIAMEHEYAALPDRGRFSSSDERLNRIWRVALHTLHLNTREFFIDGVKRDRWLWSGDAVQSYLMNYYTFGDAATVRRTTWALRGQDPVEQHVNTIIDYSFYWFIGVLDYHLFTGDTGFVTRIYPRMVTLMEFCLGRRNREGFVEELPGDWLFLDWAEIPKTGELCAEQLLLCRSLEAIACCARVVGRGDDASRYEAEATRLHRAIMDAFWDADRGVLVHHRVNGVRSPLVTRYANMFAILYDYLSPEQRETAAAAGLMAPELQRITTPYMRFYELDALCRVGQHAEVAREILAYWGGMLDHGATSFWETYDPAEQGAAQYAMYGRPYGKSLCHAWGASPVYLLGRHFLGVRPTSPGFATYEVAPHLGGLEWIEGVVPTPRGDLAVRVSRSEIRLRGRSGGVLRLQSTTPPACGDGLAFTVSGTTYEAAVPDDAEHVITYSA